MAYTAPAKDTVTVVGGLGTQEDKAALNGGGAIKTVWDAGSPSDFIDTNGGPIQTATCTFTTIDKNLSGTDIGLNVVEGTLCYVSTGTGSHITAGIYEITTVTDDDNIICINIEDDGTDESVITVNVGGAFDGLGVAINNKINDGALYIRYIYDNIASEEISSTIDVNVNSGTTLTPIRVTGYNLTLTAQAEITITTNATLTDGLLKFDGAKLNYIFRNIAFNAGGKDDTKAQYCVYDVGADSDFIGFIDCKFYGASNHGILNNSDSWVLSRCKFYDNGGDGMNNSSTDGQSNKYFSCSFYNNDSHGLSQGGSSSLITGCLAYGNGQDGAGHGLFLGSSSSDNGTIKNCTCYDNATDGINIDNLANGITIFNNTSVGNGGYGYNLQGISSDIAFFYYNHASVNTGNGSTITHCTEVLDSGFANFRDGNNIAGTQEAANIFTNVTPGAEDFTPKTGSDLINNGLDAGTA